MTDTKRQTLKEKIAAAESRNLARSEPTLLEFASETAIEAKDKVTAFARKHPVATIAGGLVIGILVSGMFRRSPTRKAGKLFGRHASRLAAIGAELAIAYGHQAYKAAGEARRAGGEKLDEWGDSIGEGAADARSAMLSTGETIARAIRSRLN